MRLSSQVLVTLTAWLVSLGAAQAAGFGAAPGSVNLGSPLSMSVALHLDDQDSAEPECVSAEVSIGDRRVPPYNVRWVVEATGQARERIVRVSTLTAIDEPVVNVQLTAGCSTRIARRYTIFADPPMVTATPPLSDMATPSGTQATTTPAPAALQSAAPSSAANRSSPNHLAVAKPSVAPQRIAAAAGRQVGAGAKQRTRKVAKAAVRSNRAIASGATPKVKLTLEPGEPPPEALALAAAMQAAASSAAAAEQSASAAIGAASAASARADALAQRVERLLTEAKQQRADNEQLRSRLAAESWSNWMWVGLLVATLVGAVGWLAWRLRRVQREAQAQWWKAAQAEVMADLKPDPDDTQSRATTLDTPQRPSEAPQPAPATAGGLPRTAHNSPPFEPQEAGWTTITPPRPVTAEELIDLEQQAEFFVVLGQDDAAVDLLVAHIRSTGGISPLPYLKLLEIYRRRGEPDTYERTRTRFNQRFNAYAPDWDSDLQAGRSLEDYPAVIASLQKCWPMPLDAMAELEALLFRKERGELFDLPAYREVMLLYSLARDLHEEQAEASNPIDLLLPLDAVSTEPANARRTTTGPFDTQLLGPQVSVDAPTTPAALDFDLSSATTFNRDVTAPGAFTEIGSLPSSSQGADLPGLDALVRGRRSK